MATSLGVLLGIPVLLPLAAGAFVVWALVFLATRYVSVASTAGALAVLAAAATVNPAEGYRLDVVSPWTHRWPLTGFVLAIVVLVLLRHRENYKRLLTGTENKFGWKKSPQREGHS